MEETLDDTLIIHIRLIETMKGRDYWLADKERLFIIEMIKCLSYGYSPIDVNTRDHMRNASFIGGLFNTYKKILIAKQWLVSKGYKTQLGRVCTDIELASFITDGFKKDADGIIMLPEVISYNFKINVKN